MTAEKTASGLFVAMLHGPILSRPELFRNDIFVVVRERRSPNVRLWRVVRGSKHVMSGKLQEEINYDKCYLADSIFLLKLKLKLRFKLKLTDLSSCGRGLLPVLALNINFISFI